MSKEALEKKNDLIIRAEEILADAKKQQRELTDAEAAELAEIRDNVRKIVARLQVEDDLRAMGVGGEKKKAGSSGSCREEDPDEQQRALEKSEEEAFENFVRGKIIHERAGELSPASESGQALIPTTIAKRIITKVYSICPILEKSDRYNVKGNLDLPFYPADSNEITVDYREEFTPMASSSGGFDTVKLSGFLAGALTKISKSLINNVDFDIVGFVVNRMAYAIRRWIERQCLIGTQNKITGLSTLSNAVTAAAANAFTADELIKLHDSIKDEFQADACWIMHPETRLAARLLKSNTGYYLLNDDVSTPFGTSILGKPVFVSDQMPKIGTGNTVVYYGNMKGLSTKFSENMSIEVLRELYAAEHAVGVIGWLEFDAKVADEQQLAKLVMA